MQLFNGADWILDTLEDRLLYVGGATSYGFYAQQPMAANEWVCTALATDVSESPPFMKPDTDDLSTTALNIQFFQKAYTDGTVVPLTTADTNGDGADQLVTMTGTSLASDEPPTVVVPDGGD